MKNVFLFILLFPTTLICQTIGTFTSVVPTAQTEQFVLPSTHTFQKLMQSGDLLSNGSALKGTPDFTCFVPIAGSSTNGYISLNHEEAPGGVTILDVNFNNSTKLWNVSHAQAADLSPINGITLANCSGGLTPWGTVLSGEEYVWDYNNDGFNDTGWFVEVNPATRQVTRKLWALGCTQHENAAVSTDGTKIYFGADNPTWGYLYKFVCTTANDPTSGVLYALKLTSGGNGNWVVIPNTTQSERSNTMLLSAAAGATNISGVGGVEDVEIGPDGKIYLTSKYSQEIYRLTDNGTTVSNYETFVSNQSYTINGTNEPYGYAGQNGNDNLAFDGEGNLWILQDGGRNHIWVVPPTHAVTNTTDVRLFATTPTGSEPTGITFSPDYKFLFISIQHPNNTNAATQTDAAGNTVVFNRAATLVVARKEFLGNYGVLAVDFKEFYAQIINGNKVELNWQLNNSKLLQKTIIERSADGVHFEKIGEEVPPQYILEKTQFLDDNPLPVKNYYRLKCIDINGTETVSKVISVLINDNLPTIKLSSNPFNNESTLYYAHLSKSAKVLIYNAFGQLVWSKNIENTEGSLFIGASLNSGVYFLKIDTPNADKIKTIKLIKK